MTILLLFCVHKIIIAIPTYSGASMNRINYTTLALGLLMGFFALNHQIAGKMGVIFERVNDMWEGKSGDSNEQKPRSKGKSKVSVSQPISGRPQMHQPSRADHLGTQNQSSMMPTAQDTGATSQNMYMDQTGDGNLLISAQEPMAANMALGGGGSWSAW